MKCLEKKFELLPLLSYGGIFLQSISIDDQINMQIWWNIKKSTCHDDRINILDNLVIKGIYKI